MVTQSPSEEANDELVVPVRAEADLNHVRMVARETCSLVGVRGYNGQKVVTAVSELARNVARYAGGGEIRFRIDTGRGRIVIVAEDKGPGIPNLDEIMAGQYRSRTGLGRGILGAKALADHFDINTGSSGTKVVLEFKFSEDRTRR